MRRILLAAAVLPVGLASLVALNTGSADAAAPSCSVQVVAHQDDDLLFQSPRLISVIRGGLCVRTVYVTAGDANDTAAYWASRESGMKTAYAQLAEVANSWTTADFQMRFQLTTRLFIVVGRA